MNLSEEGVLKNRTSLENLTRAASIKPKLPPRASFAELERMRCAVLDLGWYSEKEGGVERESVLREVWEGAA